MLTAFLSFVFVFIVTIQDGKTTHEEHGKNCHCQCCMRAFHS